MFYACIEQRSTNGYGQSIHTDATSVSLPKSRNLKRTTVKQHGKPPSFVYVSNCLLTFLDFVHTLIPTSSKTKPCIAIWNYVHCTVQYICYTHIDMYSTHGQHLGTGVAVVHAYPLPLEHHPNKPVGKKPSSLCVAYYAGSV